MEQNPSINNVSKINEPIKERDIKLQITRSTRAEQNRNEVQKYQCKICLAQIKHQNVEQQNAISPCSCSGSMKYIHQGCLRHWLNSIVMRNLQNGQNTDAMGCQICKQPYIYDIYEKVLCVKKQIKTDYKIVLLIIFFTLFAIGTIVFFAIFSFTDIIKIGDSNNLGPTVFILVTICMIIILGIWIYRFISVFLIKRISLIRLIKSRQPYPQNQQLENTNNTLNIILN